MSEPIGYTEICPQEYSNGKYIEAGLVDNHPHDEIYLAFRDTTILLRPDEAATIVWALGGALFSLLLPDTDEQALKEK